MENAGKIQRIQMNRYDKINYFNSLANKLDKFKARNKYYNEDIKIFLKTLIPEGKKILEIGCATGSLLKGLEPSRGLGIDFSQDIIGIAKKKYGDIDFKVMDAENIKIDEKFDYIIMSDLIGHLSDVWQAFRELHKVCDTDTKIIITYYNYIWQPLLKLAEKLRLKTPIKSY